MFKRWKVREVLSQLNNDDVPHFIITVLLLIYLEIDLAIRILKILKKLLTTDRNIVII